MCVTDQHAVQMFGLSKCDGVLDEDGTTHQQWYLWRHHRPEPAEHRAN